MGILLSLLTAVTFGAADFAGGLASRRTNVVSVIFFAHLIGLVGVLIAAPLLATSVVASDLLLGAAGGIAALAGLVLLYRRLAAGPMSVVAPITAITSALVPAAWAILRGESLSLWVGVGMLAALVAIGLISVSPDADGADVVDSTDVAASGRSEVTPMVILESLGAGTGFGVFFILINATEVSAAPWPIVGARVASVTLVGLWVLTRRVARPSGSTNWAWIVVAGTLDTFSNVLFLWSADLAGLSVASVLSSLYPASTVVLAFVILRERMSRTQLAGFLLAVAATVLIASG